jgi:hypothetical protein
MIWRRPQSDSRGYAVGQDRPEEFKLHRLNAPMRGEAEGDFDRRRFGNVVALLAVLALILGGFWVFHALGTAGFQRCLDSGRSNCVDFVNPVR